MRPIRRYVRVRLHRRIFVWFGISILLTIGVVSGVVALSAKKPAWRQEIARLEKFLGSQLGRIWHQARERDRLLGDFARDVEAAVAAYDADGVLIASFGGPCPDPVVSVPVTSSNGPRPTVIGRVEMCKRYDYGRGPFVFFLTLGVAGACLWMSSGIIARRLIRPLGRVVRVARDIGDGKLESRVTIGCRHQADELGVLARAINDMAERIEKQISDQRELLAAVSHELRTPLGHMRLLIELGREGAAEPGRLDELEREVIEIDSLVGQLLASSRLAFDSLDRRPLDSAEVAERALDRAGLPASLLTVDTQDTRCRGDATLVARALANLLDNARFHGGGVSALRVTDARSDAGEPLVQFEIVDQGPGFADGEADKVFTTFYRGAHRAGQSSLGLGLALVRRIAEAHGGHAFAANRELGGARVGFAISRADRDGVAPVR